MKPWVKAVAAVRELCRLRLPQEVLVPAVLEALHGVVPSSRNLFDWCDDSGRLLHYYFEGPVDTTIAQLYFDEFHNRLEAEAMPPFEALSARPGGVHSARELDTPHFFGSALYHEIWKPQGLEYRIEAVLRGAHGRLLGSLVLYRGPREACFTRDEELRLLQVLPVFAAALESGSAPETPTRWTPALEPSETVTLDGCGRLLHASPGALRLLLMAEGGVSPASLAREPRWIGHHLLRLALRRLDELPPHAPVGAEAALMHDNDWGRFTLRARRLLALDRDAAALALVTITRHEPHAVAVERALRGLALTPRQHQVCRELIAGHAQAEVARNLGVGQASVVDQVRKAYRTLGVRSVLELRSLVESQIGR